MNLAFVIPWTYRTSVNLASANLSGFVFLLYPYSDKDDHTLASGSAGRILFCRRDDKGLGQSVAGFYHRICRGLSDRNCLHDAHIWSHGLAPGPFKSDHLL